MKNVSSKILLSVVIPHYNAINQLQACVANLDRQSVDRDRIELIVIDNASTQAIPSSIKNKVDVWLSYQKSANPYACRNIGIRSSKSPRVALLDCTCIPCHDWARQGIEALETHAVAAGVFRKIVDQNDAYAMFYSVSHLNNTLKVQDRAPIVAGNLFLKKLILSEVGYFPEGSRSGGDIKWSQSVRLAGIEIGLAEDASVTIKAKSKPQVISSERRFGRGAYLQNRDMSMNHHLKMILYHLLPDKPSRIKRKIAVQPEPEVYKGKVWALWWVTWHTNLLFLQGYLSGLLLPDREMYLD